MHLARRAALALLTGFPAAMAVTAVGTLAAEAIGWVDLNSTSELSEVDFIFQVDPFSFVVALLAGAAGMLSLDRRNPLRWLVFSSQSPRGPDTKTDAPSRPNAVAVARPITVSAPVTNATCSLMGVPPIVRHQLPLRFAHVDDSCDRSSARPRG